MWRAYYMDEVIMNECDMYFLKFNSNEGGNNDGGWKTVNYRRYGRNEGVNGGMYKQRNNYGEGSSNRGAKKNEVLRAANANDYNKSGKCKSKVDEEAYDNMVSQIGMGNSEYMNDEVVEDRSSIAQSTDSCKGCRIDVGWDSLVISAKLLAQTDQVMHLLVKYLLDDNEMYVFVIYGENTPKSRARLWKNLINHTSIAGNKPWVLLGDFNPKPFRFMNFRADKKEFISIVKENWNVDIEDFVMFRLAKRLKFMKNHMRDLNRKNGDVFGKVKFLRTELGRVQGCLDKDPSNTSLWEEEMIYAYAFKEATLDEEKLLQQKTKIAWLKDGDFNSSYFHKVVKGRMSRSIIEVIYDDSDADIALDLIKPVNDKEIKDAFFSIVENKASRPDGYSSKFSSLLGMWWVRIYVLLSRSSLRKGAFIPGRQCSDNILLAQEFMRNYSWGYMAKNCAFRVDIQKAYDTVSWKFFKFCLRNFGFHPVMIKWIMVCLSTATFSVCVNGDSHGFFKAKRGLRQEDPISSYLFTLVMEVLNLVIKRQVNNDRRFKYHSGCGKLRIASLCFADDLLLLCYRDLVYASNLGGARNEILMAMPFKECTLHIRYLGVPLQLISYVLASLQVYWGSLFILPMSVYDKIDKLFKNFLWDRGEGSKGMDGRFDEVLDVPVSVISNDLEDKVIWIDKKGRQKNFSVFEAWKAIKTEFPKERNVRIFQQKDRSVDVLFDLVVILERFWCRVRIALWIVVQLSMIKTSAKDCCY
nr:hypothetical protein [Tanacetum cinerariifolium]